MPSDQQTVIPLREGPDRQQHRECVRKGVCVCVGLQEEEEEEEGGGGGRGEPEQGFL